MAKKIKIEGDLLRRIRRMQAKASSVMAMPADAKRWKAEKQVNDCVDWIRGELASREAVMVDSALIYEASTLSGANRDLAAAWAALMTLAVEWTNARKSRKLLIDGFKIYVIPKPCRFVNDWWFCAIRYSLLSVCRSVRMAAQLTLRYVPSDL